MVLGLNLSESLLEPALEGFLGAVVLLAGDRPPMLPADPSPLDPLADAISKRKEKCL